MKFLYFFLLVLIPLSYNLQLSAAIEPLLGQAKIDSLLSELPKAKGDTNEVKLLKNLSLLLVLINPEKGLDFGLKGLKLAEKIGWDNGKAICYNSVACNYINKSEFSKAVENLQKAVKINIEDGEKINLSENYINIGNVFYMQSNYPNALKYYQKALKINEEIGNKSGQSKTLGNIGVIYNSQSNYSKALEYQKEALKINEEIGNKSGQAANFGNIGAIYQIQSNYPNALKYYHKALNMNVEVGNKTGQALVLGNIGAIYSSQSNFHKAIESLQKSLMINIEIDSQKGLAYNYLNIGELYLSLSQDSILSKVKIESQYVNLDKEVNLNKSIEFTLQAEKIFREIHGINELSQLYNTLHKAYYQKGMYKQSIDAHIKYIELRDSVFSQENTYKIADLEKSREEDLKQKEIEKQKIMIAEQEKRERLILYFSIGIVLLMAVVMFIIFRLLKRADKLLYNVLPISIAKRLKNKEHPISDYFEQASIVFIDIVNFTELAKDEDPRRVVEALNKIFTQYDEIANKFGLEKIKTIGDSYMAAAGIPLIQKDNAHRAAQMALEVKAMMADYHTSDGTKIEVRIGLDCGPVVAGVIGENKFIYDMWSDAVNTASRMESSSIAGQVHVSERFKDAVTEYEQFDYVERGEMEIKGKGKMKTYFIGEKVTV